MTACAGAGLIDDETYVGCMGTATHYAHIRLRGWTATVALCDAHHELWVEEAAIVNRAAGRVPTAVTVVRPLTDGQRLARRIADLMRSAWLNPDELEGDT